MSEEHSLVDIMAIARRRWIWVAAPIVLLVVLAWLFAGRQTLRYEATARVVLSEDASTRALDPGSQNPGYLQREIENQIALAYGNEVEALVVAELGELPELAVSHNPESDILLFRAQSSTAEDAAAAANAWAEIFVTVRLDRDMANIAGAMEGLESRLQTLEAEREAIRAPLDSLRRQIQAATDQADTIRLQQNYDLLSDDLRYELDLNSSEAQSTVDDITRLRLQSELAAAEQNRIAEPAQVPDGPANTPLSRILVIAVLAGTVVGLGLAVLIDAQDKSIRTSADLQDLTDLPLLATVPKAKRSQRPAIGLAAAEDPKGILADSFHQIRSALEFEIHHKPLGSVMVTSPAPGDGRSTVASNLALALGSVGAQTALVDSDYRAGSLHRTFNIRQEPGLSDLVRREIEASRVARYVSGDGSEDVVVLPSGTVPANPAAFVASPRFLSTLNWMSTQVDIVVIDSPPVLGVPETHTLGREVDGVILVVRTKRTTEDELRDAIAVLDQVQARVVGVVLLGVPKPRRTLRQYLRARRQAAQNLPPVLNVSEGPRTADYQAGDATGPSAEAGIVYEDPPAVAGLGAGQQTGQAGDTTGQPPHAAKAETADDPAQAAEAVPEAAPYNEDLDPLAERPTASHLDIEIESDTGPDRNGFVILAAAGDKSDSSHAAHSSNGVADADGHEDHQNGLNGYADTTEDDWFHDRTRSGANGTGATAADIGNGADSNGEGIDAIERVSAGAEADPLELPEDEQAEMANGSGGHRNGHHHLISPEELVDKDIFDLAELDEGLVE